MGLDVYAGTLTRYYAGNWKSIVQQWAEENGYAFHRITASGDAEEKTDLTPEVIQEDMEAWRDGLLTALAQSEQITVQPWVEDNIKPYFTDKPDWDAFGAMLLLAACLVYGEPVPEKLPKDDEFFDHPLLERLAEDEAHAWSLARGAVWWVPIEASLMCQGPLPTGDQALIATTGALRAELAMLNELAWQADESTILSWSQTEGYGADDEDSEQEMDVQSLAKFAFSIFYQALRFAEAERVPIVLDF